MSKSWGKIGAWAAEAEREEAEEKAQAAAAAAAAGAVAAPTTNFPSLKEASSTKQKKKKMTLQEFNMQQQQQQAPRGLTPEEMLRLPTGPTQRAPGEESSFGRLGGGFSNYGRRDRDPRDEDRDRGGGRRSYGGFDDDRRGTGPPRVSDFDQPSRADEADNWATGKRSSFPLPESGRSNRYGDLGGGGGGGGGGFGGMSRADEVDNWGAGKKPLAPVRSSTFGSNYRDSRPEMDRPRGFGFGVEGEREQPSERRRLVLDPPRGEGLGVSEPVVKTSSNKPNPFGAARPREEVLAEKGVDWKKADLVIEAKKSSGSRPGSEHSSRPSSAQSSRSEGLGLQGTEGAGSVKQQSRPKVNPFGDAKPREVLLEQKGMDWRKIDLDLEHRGVDRPETEAEKIMKEEIERLKKELESSSHANGEPVEGSGEDQTALHDQIASRQMDLELLTRELDDKVRFGQKAIERPGSGAGRVSGFHERPNSQSGPFQEPRNVEFMDRPRSRGTGDMWSRQVDDRRSFQGGREGGFLSSRDMDRPRSRDRRW